MTDRARERSAFCTRRGLFHFIRMPFGLSGDPASFCRLMSIVLRDMLWKICLCYLDDIIIFGKTPQELLDRLHQVFSRFAEVGLKVKPSKTVLFKQKLTFLGTWLQPKVSTRCLTSYKRDVRAFFGLASYYRRFVRNFASIAEPLTRLTKKNNTPFKWTDDANRAFRQLKDALLDATTLAFPIPGTPCILDTDASDVLLAPSCPRSSME